ncbi:MAG: hypothetical protein JO306_15420 [Gemmatimonadetes bacterium]|nr:hypothetical protein [Gemmatimonadota bacterium]
MRKSLLAAVSLLPLWACSSDGTSAGVATRVSLSATTLSFDALGDTRIVHAAVTNQRGGAMANPSLAWSSSSSAATVVSAGGDSAVVTSVANGDATITASAGSAAASLAVQVAQAPAALRKAAGDQQSGIVAAPLPSPLRVVVVDRAGTPMAGRTVAFAVAQGGGSVTPQSAVTGADGAATATWTLGTTAAVSQAVTAAADGLQPATFSAVAIPGAPETASAAAGDRQVGAIGGTLPVAPGVRVADRYGNAVAGVAVAFAVTGGGGSVTGASAVSGRDGVASVGGWRLGATPGTNALSATVQGIAIPPITFTATALVIGKVSLAGGDNQAAMAGTAVAQVPAVVVRDSAGNPLSGLTVTFAVTSGGGTVTGATATTDASGTASAGSWVMGSGAGPNGLSASVSGGIISGGPIVFSAIACSGGGGAGYAITLCPVTAMTASQLAAFRDAAARWQAAITGDLPDASVNFGADACGSGTPSIGFHVDDLLIFAGVQPIDGAGRVLGFAGWCVRRSAGLPVIGVMSFDAADVAPLESAGQFDEVVLHEMGHVLGIGSLWNSFGLLQDPTGPIVQDTWYSGAGGQAAFDAIGGTAYTAGHKVPVENTGGQGTANGHWRESVLHNELMTGWLDAGANPLSLVTVRSLADLGYAVDPSAAEPYTLPPQPSPNAAPARGLLLGDDTYRGPRFTVDHQGRVTRLR